MLVYNNKLKMSRWLLLPDMETAIMHKLQNIVLEHTNTLLSVQDLAAELDW